jgi:hypothetical protein
VQISGTGYYPACKRTAEDVDGDVRSIWDHTRLEAMRYPVAVPSRGFQLLNRPARQAELLDTFLRQRPHEDIVFDFTVSTQSNLAIAATAGFNWLNHCATIAGVERDRFLGTLSHFRRILSLAQQWWALEGADARCDRMLHEQQTAPLLLN